MNYVELESKINRLLSIPISRRKIAEIIGTSAQNLNKKFHNPKTQVLLTDVQKLENALSVSLIDTDDCITIDHIHINPSCGTGTIVLTEADVTPIKIGREIIKNIWNSKPEDLKIFKASGDSMQETITDNDLLLIDLSKTDFRNGGIFLLTINNDWYIKRLRMRLTGELDIISDNSKYPIETLKPDTTVEIKVIGRVIKNLSKGL